MISTVKDSGCGMTEETKQSLFDPYYTTKATNSGTGLGLSIVREIVDELGGYIEFASEIGQGTEFDIYIPAAERVESPVLPPAIGSKNIHGGTETVLIADDEEVIRSLAQEVLEMYGYRVLKAVDGQEALEIFEREFESIDVVILDVCMPRMSGDEVLPLLLQKKPELKAILCSGFGQERVSDKNLNFGSMAFLNKPYRTLDLLAAVRDVLDHSDAI
ncbi:MAG: response regulator [Candidatus Brocadiia bacterium]|nr:MAG: response regulator [Candidatus Brocadiia bacterium]